MLQRIFIENFKAIGNRVEIDLAPITLLVGPNSVGKSSILQAIHYAAEILAGQHPGQAHQFLPLSPADVHHTQLSGGQLDLGGFKSFVHNGEKDRIITLGFEKAWKPGSYEDEHSGTFIIDNEAFNSCKLKPPLIDFSHSWRVVLRIGHGVVKEILVDINDEPMVRYHALRPKCEIALNARHSLFVTIFQERRLPVFPAPVPNTPDWLEHLFRGAYGDEYCDTDGWCRRPINSTYVDVLAKVGGGKVPLCDDSHGAINEQLHQEFELLANVLLLEPLRDLKGILQNAKHLGPLRSIPGRSEFGQVSKSGQSHATWYDGSAAWQSTFDDATFEISGWLPEANDFLTLQHLMSGNYKFFIREDRTLRLGSRLLEILDPPPKYGQLPHSKKEELSRELQKLSTDSTAEPVTQRRIVIHDIVREVDVKPQDVGTGISQVFPTLAASLSGDGGYMAMIEHPELHLHPRAQLALGDVFIHRVKMHFLRGGHRPDWLGLGPEPLIVETHSEHIVLRLLRRIRETGEGKHKQGGPGFLTPDELCVVYVERLPDGPDGTPGKLEVRQLHVDPTGEFIDRWPNGFFDERAEELF